LSNVTSPVDGVTQTQSPSLISSPPQLPIHLDKAAVVYRVV
jgi:hypothetical protein